MIHIPQQGCNLDLEVFSTVKDFADRGSWIRLTFPDSSIIEMKDHKLTIDSMSSIDGLYKYLNLLKITGFTEIYEPGTDACEAHIIFTVNRKAILTGEWR
ncbi:MAG: hypothetical protein GXY14_13520 [Spirochaetes bacterium]|nr:hypothetical protein [Spirochaetota bacterium]